MARIGAPQQERRSMLRLYGWRGIAAPQQERRSMLRLYGFDESAQSC